jgi:hypothetical protein
MAEAGTSATMLLAFLGLLAGILGCVLSFRQFRVGASQYALSKLESLHQAAMEALDARCDALETESALHHAHARLCEAELARLKALLP